MDSIRDVFHGCCVRCLRLLPHNRLGYLFVFAKLELRGGSKPVVIVPKAGCLSSPDLHRLIRRGEGANEKGPVAEATGP